MIRKAITKDVNGLIDLGMSFFVNSEYKQFVNAKEDCLRTMFESIIESEDGVWLVCEIGERLVGMIGVKLFQHPYSGDPYAYELAWWVEPEVRSLGVGLKLLMAAEEWAKEHGALFMNMVAPNNSIERLYGRLGYSPVERYFQKSIG